MDYQQLEAQFKAVLLALITISIPHVEMPPFSGNWLCGYSDPGAGIRRCGADGSNELIPQPPMPTFTPPVDTAPSMSTDDTPTDPSPILPDDLFGNAIWVTNVSSPGGTKVKCRSFSGVPHHITSRECTTPYGGGFPETIGHGFGNGRPPGIEVSLQRFRMGVDSTSGYVYGEAEYALSGACNGSVDFEWHCGWRRNAVAPDP